MRLGLNDGSVLGSSVGDSEDTTMLGDEVGAMDELDDMIIVVGSNVGIIAIETALGAADRSDDGRDDEF